MAESRPVMEIMGVSKRFDATQALAVGIERPEADTTDEARKANFSNEAGALGGFRFLKNVVGFWILE
jgi:hypothetical protein